MGQELMGSSGMWHMELSHGYKLRPCCCPQTLHSLCSVRHPWACMFGFISCLAAVLAEPAQGRGTRTRWAPPLLLLCVSHCHTALAHRDISDTPMSEPEPGPREPCSARVPRTPLLAAPLW